MENNVTHRNNKPALGTRRERELLVKLSIKLLNLYNININKLVKSVA